MSERALTEISPCRLSKFPPWVGVGYFVLGEPVLRAEAEQAFEAGGDVRWVSHNTTGVFSYDVEGRVPGTGTGLITEAESTALYEKYHRRATPEDLVIIDEAALLLSRVALLNVLSRKAEKHVGVDGGEGESAKVRVPIRVSRNVLPTLLPGQPFVLPGAFSSE